MNLVDALIAEQLSQEPQPAPPVEQPGLAPQPSLGALAAAVGKGPKAGTKVTMKGGKTPQQIVWNADRTRWRYPASNAWQPASTAPRTETLSKKVEQQ